MASILKVGEIKSKTGNDSISIADNGNTTANGTLTATGAITASGGIANAGTISAGNIGPNVTITDGANPHGWEHIKTISYNADTSTPQKMSNVISSKYSAYKIIMQWGVASGDYDLYFRFLDSSDNEITTAKYSYGCQIIAENSAEGELMSSTANTTAVISNDSVQGSRGWNGEIKLFNCYASSSDYPQIDGYQLNNSRPKPASPHAVYSFTGHDNGNYDLGGFGFFWIDVDPQYVTGFQLKWGSGGSVDVGSYWSCYGLKLPTAD